jgi:hypothetical protein
LQRRDVAAHRAAHGVGSGRLSAGVERPDHEDRAAAQPLGRRPVAKDQLANGATAARVAVVEDLRLAGERAAGGVDVDRSVDEQIRGPCPIERAGGDENRAVGLVDEADRDRPPLPAPPAARPEPGEPRVTGKGLVEGGDALGAAGRAGRGSLGASRLVGLVGPVAGARQRLRCQDLPSVATDGASTISTRCISAIVRAPSAAIDWRSAPTRFSDPSVT